MRKNKFIWREEQHVYHHNVRPYRYKQYGFWAFMLDLFMFMITSGLWLIWIFIREMRRR